MKKTGRKSQSPAVAAAPVTRVERIGRKKLKVAIEVGQLWQDNSSAIGRAVRVIAIEKDKAVVRNVETLVKRQIRLDQLQPISAKKGYTLVDEAESAPPAPVPTPEPTSVPPSAPSTPTTADDLGATTAVPIPAHVPADGSGDTGNS